MEAITARLLFRVLNDKTNSIESTSEEILPYLTDDVSITLNLGSVFNFRGVDYKVEKIETHLSEKTKEIYGMSYAEKIGRSYPYSISISYTVSEVIK